MGSEPTSSPNAIKRRKFKPSALSLTACFGKIHHHESQHEQGHASPSLRHRPIETSPDPFPRAKSSYGSHIISPRLTRTLSKSQDKCRNLINRIGGSSAGGGGKHFRRHSADFHYDALSYSLNFDRGRDDEQLDEFPLRCFSARLPASPPPSLVPETRSAAPTGKEEIVTVPSA